METAVSLITGENETFFEQLLIQPVAKKADIRIGLICDDIACGVACLKIVGQIMQITWLYIEENYITDESMEALFGAIIELGKNSGTDIITYNRYESHIISYLDYINADIPGKEMTDYLKDNGFVCDDFYSPVYRVKVKTILDYFDKKPIRKVEGVVHNLESVTSSVSRQIYEAWGNNSELDVENCDFELYDSKLSRVLTENKQFRVAIFIRKTESRDLWIDALVTGKDVAVFDFYAVMKECARAAKDMQDRDVYINVVNDKITKLITHITGGNYDKVGAFYTYIRG